MRCFPTRHSSKYLLEITRSNPACCATGMPRVGKTSKVACPNYDHCCEWRWVNHPSRVDPINVQTMHEKGQRSIRHSNRKGLSCCLLREDGQRSGADYWPVTSADRHAPWGRATRQTTSSGWAGPCGMVRRRLGGGGWAVSATLGLQPLAGQRLPPGDHSSLCGFQPPRPSGRGDFAMRVWKASRGFP